MSKAKAKQMRKAIAVGLVLASSLALQLFGAGSLPVLIVGDISAVAACYRIPNDPK